MLASIILNVEIGLFVKVSRTSFQTILRHLYWNETLADAINAKRIHHQLIPMRVEYDEGLDDELFAGLQAKGHTMYLSPSDSGFASLTGISRIGDDIQAVYDVRRIGSAVVF